MEDYFFKIFTSLRNCYVACSPALRLGGASEQLSGLCLRSHDPHLMDPWWWRVARVRNRLIDLLCDSAHVQSVKTPVPVWSHHIHWKESSDKKVPGTKKTPRPPFLIALFYIGPIKPDMLILQNERHPLHLNAPSQSKWTKGFAGWGVPSVMGREIY